MKTLSKRKRNILRTHERVVEQEIRGLKTNQELRELCKYLDVVAYIKERWEWTGNVAAMDQGRTFKVFESKPEKNRIREDLE
jgi:hypothetical protein